jgi:hypothetical protein
VCIATRSGCGCARAETDAGDRSRRSTQELVAFIDAHRQRTSADGPVWASARAVRDAELVGEARQVHAENYSVYGADKGWTQLNRQGTRVACCTVEGLMCQEGLRGTVRGRAWMRTTVAGAERPADLVDRDFRASALNRRWVADLTFMKNPRRVGVGGVRD